MTEALKMYPSGFLGSATVAQTEPMSAISTARQLFNKGMHPQVSRYVANAEVNELWAAVNAGTPEFREFAFRERVLKAALAAFGTTRLVDWVGSQIDSPYHSDYHRRWIDETLAFVYGGVRRSLSENNWRVLLTTSQTPVKAERFSRVAKHYLLGEKLRTAPHQEPYRGDVTIVDFIAEWCARDGGFKDMLSQLNNLLGRS